MSNHNYIRFDVQRVYNKIINDTLKLPFRERKGFLLNAQVWSYCDNVRDTETIIREVKWEIDKYIFREFK